MSMFREFAHMTFRVKYTQAVRRRYLQIHILDRYMLFLLYNFICQPQTTTARLDVS